MSIVKTSAGLLMYRRAADGAVELLLAHPGGPFWANKDEGAWSIPKGEPDPGETDLLATARREFEEETGVRPEGPFIALRPVTQKNRKVVHAWAFAGDCDPAAIRCNECEIEWPPRSGRRISFPEIDRVEFFGIETARRKINPAQAALLDELLAALEGEGGEA